VRELKNLVQRAYLLADGALDRGRSIRAIHKRR
jgi:transcriptional regulator with GAF, ATPase, and Fis domain